MEMTTELIVKRKDVYGVSQIYPVCDQSLRLAKLCGTKTLTNDAIKTIKLMGFVIREQVTASGVLVSGTI